MGRALLICANGDGQLAPAERDATERRIKAVYPDGTPL